MPPKNQRTFSNAPGMPLKLLLGTVLITQAITGAPFQNLDFEAAKFDHDPIGGDYALASEAIPGWSASWYSMEAYQDPPEWWVFPVKYVLVGFAPPEGAYLILAGGISGKYGMASSGYEYESTRIVQHGDVPKGARFLEYDYFGEMERRNPNDPEFFQQGPFSGPGFNDHSLTPMVVGPGPAGSLHIRCDISAWSGTEVTLSFSIANGTKIDNISFVPEPGLTGALMGGAMLSFGVLRRIRR